jgi:conjugative transfer signal peptidase TraF
VPDPRDIPLVRWGEELRRLRLARLAGRRHTILVALVAVLATALLASLLWPPRPLLVWNASASSPVGLYRVSPAGRLARGDMVVAWAPGPARTLAAERHYLPGNVPLVKRVAAVAGDWVCAEGDAIYVNESLVARRRHRDPSGRELPWWSDCRALEPGEAFLLMPGATSSFDGRYFGITQAHDIVGRASLIWAG